jgi:hypothetical protein
VSVTVAGDSERAARAAVIVRVSVAGDSDLRADAEEAGGAHFFLDTFGKHFAARVEAAITMARSWRRARRRARSVTPRASQRDPKRDRVAWARCVRRKSRVYEEPMQHPSLSDQELVSRATSLCFEGRRLVARLIVHLI